MYQYQYPANLEDNGEGGFIVSFRDIPEINTEIWNMDELFETGKDALITAADICFEKRIIFPKPSKKMENEVLIPLPISVVAKILLLNTMVEGNIRAADLARKMNIKAQEVNRIINLRHNTKIDTIQTALKALNKDFQLAVVWYRLSTKGPHFGGAFPFNLTNFTKLEQLPHKG